MSLLTFIIAFPDLHALPSLERKISGSGKWAGICS